MSRIYKLMEELCPCGVRYMRIEELCNISRGKVMSKEFINNNSKYSNRISSINILFYNNKRF